jgi:hypothetical protein
LTTENERITAKLQNNLKNSNNSYSSQNYQNNQISSQEISNLNDELYNKNQELEKAY